MIRRLGENEVQPTEDHKYLTKWKGPNGCAKAKNEKLSEPVGRSTGKCSKDVSHHKWSPAVHPASLSLSLWSECT